MAATLMKHGLNPREIALRDAIAFFETMTRAKNGS